MNGNDGYTKVNGVHRYGGDSSSSSQHHRHASGSTSHISHAHASTSKTILSETAEGASVAGGDATAYDSIRNVLCTQPAWTSEQERVLLQPYTHLASRPGKEIRSQMIDAFNVWLQVPAEKIVIIKKVIGMLHTSSLLVDDVEDDSILRRGAPVAHAIYGIPQTINTANYVYFLVFAELQAMRGDDDKDKRESVDGRRDNPHRVEGKVVQELLNLHRGQGMDLYWRDSLICPTEAEYVEMVNNKTSGLLRIVIKLMVANSAMTGGQGGDDDGDDDKERILVPLVNLIGLLFQIRDDYLNLQSGDYAQNKGYCEDLTEGKFSFPIIHSIRASQDSGPAAGSSAAAHSSHTEQMTLSDDDTGSGHHQSDCNGSTTLNIIDRDSLLSTLRRRPQDAVTKRLVIDYMDRQTGSFTYTRQVMTRLDRLLQGEVASVEKLIADGKQNAHLRGLLAALRKGWSQEDMPVEAAAPSS